MMVKKFTFQSLMQRVAMVILASMLFACSSTPTTTSSDSMLPSTSDQLSVVRDLLKAGEFGNAQTQLQLINSKLLSKRQLFEYQILQAQTALALNQATSGLEYIAQLRINHPNLQPIDDQRVTLLKVALLENNQDLLAATRERVFIASELNGRTAKQNHEQIWTNLMRLNSIQLREQSQKISQTQLAGWLELATIIRQAELSIDEHLAAVKNWQQRWPAHPATRRLPGSLKILSDLAANRPKKVTLALPLSGRLASSGTAIRDGFMAMYFDALAKNNPVPDIQVIDSQSTSSMSDIYQASLNHDSEWLVGPLAKTQVATLQQQDSLPIPTLALNYAPLDSTNYDVESNRAPSNLYQFGLAAEDEAQQIANYARQQGLQRALIMLPKGDWGERIYKAFRSQWLAVGGQIAEVRYYGKARDYNPDVKALLNVDNSQKRYQGIRQMIKGPVEFEPRRRSDADWVFLAALPAQARQIKPTLAFNFAADLPVYATSHLFSGVIDSDRDRDLDGIRFCDTPWLLQQPKLFQVVEEATGGQGAFARLYALGTDAYRLIARARQLEAFPDSQVFGSTGAIQLGQDRRLIRKTDCSVFRRGKPVQVTSVNS